jgi:predicted TIM-barrel fold metal-dependent hydrolase
VSDPQSASSRVIPRIISVDDHVIEPPDLWQQRLPKKFVQFAPHVERMNLTELDVRGGKYHMAVGRDGKATDVWLYEGVRIPLREQIAAVGLPKDREGVLGITYDEIRPGCFSQVDRLVDMTTNHTEVSLCFPTISRFCGQTFLEATDHELALLCVQAYNDWMVEEWCAGSGNRLVPLIILPLWDPVLAAKEVERNAGRGVRAVAFSEIPAYLGLPSVHNADHWDPLFRACAEAGMVVCMHIGSSSRLQATSDDAPGSVSAALVSINSMMSLTDFLFSGVLERNPTLRIAYSESQIGWIPFILERCDTVWRDQTWTAAQKVLPLPPSEYYRRQVFGCFFDDTFGVENLDSIGLETVTFETDYPHVDSTWPNSADVLSRIATQIDAEALHQIVRGNALRMLSIDKGRLAS